MKGLPRRFSTIDDLANCISIPDLAAQATLAANLYLSLEKWGQLGGTARQLAAVIGKIYLSSAIIVFEGDSLTYGAFSTDPYPNQMQDDLIYSPDLTIHNVATSGDDADIMLSDAQAQVDAYYNAAKAYNIAILWAGTNDIGTHERSAETIHANLSAWCSGRKAVGFRVLICTLTANSHTYSGYSPAQYAQIQTTIGELNTLIQENYTDYADGLVDLAADPILGDYTRSQTDQVYWTDGLHLTAAGDTLVAQLVRDGIADLIS